MTADFIPDTEVVFTHSPECRKWFLAFTAAKQFLMKAQRTCPACLAKHPIKEVSDAEGISSKSPGV